MDLETLRNLSSQAENRIAAKAEETVPPVETEVETPAVESEVEGESSADETETPAVEKPAADKKAPTLGNAKVAIRGQDGKFQKTVTDQVVEKSPTETPAAQAADSQTYKPNLKYRVDQQEKEIPEYLRPLIKDKDSESKIRDLVERAEGLPVVKQRFNETRTALRGLQGEVESKLAFAKKKDFDSFFTSLGISEEDIYAWTLKKAEFSQLPPERQQEVEAARQASLRAEQFERQSQTVEARYHQMILQQHQQEIQTVLARTDIADVAKAYDERVGQPGTFERAVQQYGKAMLDDQGVELTVEEAAIAVRDHLGKLIGYQGQATQAPVLGNNPEQRTEKEVPNATVTPSTPVVAQTKKPPTIPNLQGGSSSPTKSAPKSIEDLKKLSAEASARMARRG